MDVTTGTSPTEWTQQDVDAFIDIFNYANKPNDPKGDKEDYSYWKFNRYMPDYCMVAVLKYLIKKP